MEEIERVIGSVRMPCRKNATVRALGMPAHHYAPRTPVRIELHNSVFLCQKDGLRIGFLAFRSPPKRSSHQFVEVVSKRGGLREAAPNLFAALHSLDVPGLDLIPEEPVSRNGLGLAVMDRFERTSTASGENGGNFSSHGKITHGID